MVVDGQIIKNQFLTKSTTEGLRVTILSTIELIVVYLTSLCVNWEFNTTFFLFDEPLKGSKSLKTFTINLTFRFDKL
jgi:hypothetical protein